MYIYQGMNLESNIKTKKLYFWINVCVS